MFHVLVWAIAAVFAVFSGLTLLIVVGKVWRETSDAYRRSRRREIEPAILAFAHADTASPLPALGGRLRVRDRRVVEGVIFDHVHRVRGIERERLGRALEELGFVDRYLHRLRGPRWWSRADAAEKLGLAGAKRATEALVAAMDDEKPEVRIRAAKALGSVGGKRSVRPLIHALDEPNRWSTIRIADILSGMGRQVSDELIATFDELKLSGKLAALDIVGRIRPLEAVPWLRERSKDAHPDVRARACHALGEIGEPGSAAVLREALVDKAWPVRAMAAKALGKIGDREAIPLLCESLRDSEWWVRANAADALRSTGDDGLAALDGMIDDADAFAGDQAVAMLQVAGVLDDHVGRLASEDEGERGRAEEWVGRLVRAGRTQRIEELAERHRDPRVRDRLRAMLAGPGETAS